MLITLPWPLPLRIRAGVKLTEIYKNEPGNIPNNCKFAKI